MSLEVPVMSKSSEAGKMFQILGVPYKRQPGVPPVASKKNKK